MSKFRFTKKALNDLSDIWDYTIETWSENQAEKYYLFLIDACSEIAKKPEKGIDYKEIRLDLKGKRMLKHIIFYRTINDNSIEIIRILHVSTDYHRRIND